MLVPANTGWEAPLIRSAIRIRSHTFRTHRHMLFTPLSSIAPLFLISSYLDSICLSTMNFLPFLFFGRISPPIRFWPATILVPRRFRWGAAGIARGDPTADDPFDHPAAKATPRSSLYAIHPVKGVSTTHRNLADSLGYSRTESVALRSRNLHT
jgi:hypothetical protein